MARVCRDGPEAVRFVGIDVLPEEVLEEAKASLLDACPGLRPANVVMISADYATGIPLAVQRYDVLPERAAQSSSVVM